MEAEFPPNAFDNVLLSLQQGLVRSNFLKGAATLMITMFYMKDLNKP